MNHGQIKLTYDRLNGVMTDDHEDQEIIHDGAETLLFLANELSSSLKRNSELEAELVAYRADAARINFIADKCLSQPHGLFHWALTSDTPHIRDAIDRERTK